MATIVETTDAPFFGATPYTIAAGDIFQGTIGTLYDRDAVDIELHAGFGYRLVARGVGESPLSSFGGFFSGLENPSHISTSRREYTDSTTFDFLVEEKGSYGFLLSARSSLQTGDYEFELIRDVVETDDAGDTAATARDIDIDRGLVGTISDGDDSDWFAVTLEAGVNYAFGTSIFPSGAATIITLYNGDGEQIAASRSEIVYGSETGGEFYIGVTGFLSNDMGNYRLTAYEDDDSLIGGDGTDVMLAEDGRQIFRGRQGDDVAYGGKGRDGLYGEDGNDLLKGGNQRDVLYGGDGRDTIYGGNGNDLIHGDRYRDDVGADILRGGKGDDVITGGHGNDKLSGGQGNDDLNGDTGRNVLRGGAGEDTLTSYLGDDTLYGGADADVFEISTFANDIVIADFDVTEDVLDINGQDTDRAKDLVERYGEVIDGDTVIVVAEASVTLTGVDDIEALLDAII